MGKIIILDENTSNKIAAGEVIERPASVVKELVENSIDAGASSISVEIRNGGISFIKVIDNGSGIDEDDVEIAFERHATSKIRSANDLDSISTLGFRGEALASIAAVSTVEVTTRVQKNAHGTYIKIQGGVVKDLKQTGCPAGTTFIVKDLFYNTPARFKFLKKDSTEAGYISDIVSRIALANPHISFRFLSNNSTVLHTPGNNDLLSTIFSIYGRETARQLSEIRYEENGIKVAGFAGRPEIARANRNHQSIFVNGRYVKSKVIASSIDEAYKTFLMKNKHAFIVLEIELNPLLIDINVHPTKMEVRFSDEQAVFRSVYHAINNALLSKPLAKTVQLEGKEIDRDIFKFASLEKPKSSYIQQNIEINKEHYLKDDSGKSRLIDGNALLKNNLLEKENNNTGFDETGIKQVKDISYDIKREVSSIDNNKWVKEDADKNTDVFIEINHSKDENEQARTNDQSIVDHKKETSKKNSFFKDAKIIGQAFFTYILLQQNDELILIDQHAAHERIMYEQIKKKYINNEPLSQEMVSPVVIELTNQEIRFLEEEKDFFNRLGFIYDNFGNNSIILRAVPYDESIGGVKDTFLEIMDLAAGSGKNICKKAADDTLYTIACKAAIKANKRLDDMEIKSLLDSLEDLDNPYTCPHGRPTLIRLAKYELEKMFKRIV